MRLNPLHNVLFLIAKLLQADVAALKLLPESAADWSAADVAVGDTAQLVRLGWQEGTQPPVLAEVPPEQLPMFGVSDALEVFSAPSGTYWVARISISESLLAAMPGQFISFERRGASRQAFGSIWLAFGFADSTYAGRNLQSTSPELLELVLGVAAQSLWALYHTSQVHADPVTRLPGLADYRSRLHRRSGYGGSTQDGRGLLLLLSLDDFLLLRRRFGHDHGNQLLQATAQAIEATLRKDDGVFRYGEATFAVIADVQNTAGAEMLAENLLAAIRKLGNQADFGGVTASIGYVSDTSNRDPQELGLSAEQALDRARLNGGNQVVEFAGAFDGDTVSHTNPHAGVFTADPAKDHRNSRTLWHTITLITAETDPQILCRSFTSLLEETMGVNNLFLLEPNDTGFVLLNDSRANLGGRLTPERQQLVRQALAQQKTRIHTPAEGVGQWFATPLMSRSHTLGCLYLESDDPLDATDQVFLKALADQISGALDRIELVMQQRQQSQQESAALRAQLSDLRQHLPAQPPQMVARSPAMREVLEFVAKVAPSEASVLIMGESGAGKEVMARAIHEASHRADAPLVTVDCSAITHALIDSELFGRVKGAFTGADAASEGRIAQANGGTLFLDEIGALPLDVQAKLLRFVQEKELIAFGDTRRRIIDARIVCTTNRDLLHESSQGRFRSDLYYRLQVLQVNVPPLRDRLEDLPGLVELFVERFRIQFNNNVKGLTDAAWQKLSDYCWPGNIRELQNSLLRASLTASGEEIDVDDLQFAAELPALVAAQPAAAGVPIRAQNFGTQTNVAGDRPSPPDTEVLTDPLTDSADSADNRALLASILRGQVAALLTESATDAPLGRWLADAVVLTAANVCDDIARRAANVLGVPETTLRRQLQKARQNSDNPFLVTSRQWFASLPAITDTLRAIMAEADGTGPGLADQCQALLLAEVAAQVGDDNRVGAALMGVTPPTYARWLVKHKVQTAQQQRAGGGYP